LDFNENVTNYYYPNWSTVSTAIATVNTTGLHHGVSVGSTGTNTWGNLATTTYRTCPVALFAPPTGGVNVQIPQSLTVKSVSVLPTGTSGDYGCKPGFDYGIMVDIKYQVLDQNTQPIQTSAMIPWEHIVWYDGTTSDNAIGPTRISTTSATTASDGTFHDAPVGVCKGIPFTSGLTTTQSITIKLNGTSYPVRTNNWAISSTNLPGQGTIKNGTDINKSRP
jgi:hypothetical protein